ncbi:MAG: ABC transporter ATP-binding protein [Deltaproteobacteria bacterium]|nr:ABC transporter ATP-binding protein [Deltaproteobacteria bacterium]MBI3078167.1 ABC transporter ATP-binding protein [Deltaproteobacteria bacterium]
MDPLIDVQQVIMRYRTKGGPVHALADVTLQVGRGEFVSVVGPSGCGKSTLLKIIAGLLLPSAGQVRVDGVRVSGPHPGVGVVFQSPVLLAWRTILENILLQIEVRHLSKAQYRKRALDLIALVGIQGFEDKLPYQLSGGMQQRAAICRALIHDPPLLLMDEPFGALDALTRDRMDLELQRIWLESGKTVLFITHSIPEAILLSDTIVVMSARPGRVQELVQVTFPRPRDLKSLARPEAVEAIERIRAIMGTVPD